MNRITETQYRQTTLAREAARRAEDRAEDIALYFDNGTTLRYGDAWQ